MELPKLKRKHCSSTGIASSDFARVPLIIRFKSTFFIMYFYEGLIHKDRLLIDAAACGGSLMNKSYVEAEEVIANLAKTGL